MDIVIGAGVSGLSYSNFTKNDYLILEGDSEIGGYCKSIKQDGFVWDYSGHFFHFTDPDIKSYIFERMNKQKIFDVKKESQIFYKEDYIDFPFQKNIHQLSKSEMEECLEGLYNRSNHKITNFKEMLLSKFGTGICEKFLIPYNEKLYACDLNDLDEDAMGRFFPHANLKEILQNAENPDNSSYNSNFLYPEGGAIEYIYALAKDIQKNKILLNEKVISVDIKKQTVETNTGKTYQYDNLINTMPLNKFLQLLKLDDNIQSYSSNKVMVFNLGFDLPATTSNHWIYYPSKDYIFYRVGCYSNIFNSNRMSLYVEIGTTSNAQVPDESSLLERVINDLKKVGIVTNQKLISKNFLIMNPAYVHVNKDSEEDKKNKIRFLNEKNIYSIGRYGAWKYCSIQDNIIESRELASNI